MSFHMSLESETFRFVLVQRVAKAYVDALSGYSARASR